MKQRGGHEKGSPRATWWLGPVGVLLGVLALLLAAFGGLSGFPRVFAIAIVMVPAVSGYSLRIVRLGGRRAALSSIGTAVGWILFVAFLLDWLPFLGGLGFMLFLTAQFFFPVGLLVPAAVALGFILVSQELASRAVRRLSSY